MDMLFETEIEPHRLEGAMKDRAQAQKRRPYLKYISGVVIKKCLPAVAFPMLWHMKLAPRVDAQRSHISLVELRSS